MGEIKLMQMLKPKFWHKKTTQKEIKLLINYYSQLNKKEVVIFFQFSEFQYNLFVKKEYLTEYCSHFLPNLEAVNIII